MAARGEEASMLSLFSQLEIFVVAMCRPIGFAPLGTLVVLAKADRPGCAILRRANTPGSMQLQVPLAPLPIDN